jgi:16S rRNA processing protein RimM
VTRTQGLAGWVRIEQILRDDRVFEAGRQLTIRHGIVERPTEVEAFRRQHGRTVIKLRGIDSISEAERIIGADLRLERRDLPVPEEGSFYTFQLKGCRVFAKGGECLGEVTDVLDSGGAMILQVLRGKEETLIPFAQAYLKKIDLDHRRIDVDLPEGLRGLNR